MKANFKPLALATAVAAISAGYTGAVSAGMAGGDPGWSPIVPGPELGSPFLDAEALGDLAVIPYYTVQEEWGTGVHIINTSDRTQVVKLRFRRGSDSLDALDLNVIMSPFDEWVGFLNDTDGTIRLTTQDTTCTAPLPDANGGFAMPAIYREGADEGYIEVIGMAMPELIDDSFLLDPSGQEYYIETLGVNAGTIFNSLAYNAEHVNGVPRNCAAVEENFLDGLQPPITSTSLGVYDLDRSRGTYINPSSGDLMIGATGYTDALNVLKVSWFIRDAATGIEFGNDAYHVKNFLSFPAMTNQEFGVFSGNLRGFDFPDLNGNSPEFGGNLFGAVAFDRYNNLRLAFGTRAIINDWSDNPDLQVGTDWVVTLPGQYVMLDLPEYLLSDKFDPELDGECDPAPTGTDGCDMRDIPVTAAFTIWDREEGLLTAPGDRDVVVSPSIPGQVPTTQLRTETNVIHWSDRTVMSSDYAITVDTSLLEQVSGWAKLRITPKQIPGVGDSQGICQWTVTGYAPGIDDPNDLMNCSLPALDSIPMIGFVAWERSFPANPDGNYGRAVQHSFNSGSVLLP